MFGSKRIARAVAAAWTSALVLLAAAWMGFLTALEARRWLWLCAGVVLFAAAAYVAWPSTGDAMEAELLAVGLWGWAVKMVRFVTLLLILRGLLWWLDRSLGLSFTKDVWPELTRGNLAVAVYFSSRLVAVAILGHGFL